MNAVIRKIGNIRFGWYGLVTILKEEPHMRAHFLCEIFAVLVGYFRGFPAYGIAIVIFSGFCMTCLELLNSSIERSINMVQPEFDLNVKKIKDIAAASSILMGFFYAGFWLYLLIKSFF